MSDNAIEILENVEIKPTSNRILILRTLLREHSPLSLVEIETELGTLERSSILRVLNLFLEHDVVHTIEDGRGITKYEICHGNHHCSIDDMHPHFFCEKCNKVFCFENAMTPHIDLPEGFHIRTVNYMLKGICPACSSHLNNMTE